jgi:RNA polymerase sigma-70 factor (ECF subfamily)
MAAEETELMSRYCDGDADAFRALYALLAPRVLGYLRRMTRDPALADDLLQQSFLKMHRARGAFVRGADPVPWLYAIAHRTFLDETRRKKRSRVEVGRDEPPEVRADISGAPEADVDPGADGAAALGKAAIAALDTLPAAQREAVVLTKLSGKSIAEAAEIAGVTPGAMKVRAHRGYRALRKALGGDLP